MNKNIYLFILILFLSNFITNTLSISTPSPFNNDHGGHFIDTKVEEIQHNCIHDQLEQIHFKDKPRLQSDHHLKAEAVILPPHKIRFVFNTTYLAPNSEVQTCYSVGQTVVIGNGNSTGECTTVYREPCTYTCTEADLVTKNLTDLLTKEILPYIDSALSKHLIVSNRTETNSYSEIIQCVDKYDIDIRNGFTGDFMIYVSAHPTFNGHINPVAYATSCLTYSTTGAPYLGIINFNPKYYSPYTNLLIRKTNYVQWTTLLKVGVHEAIHALGFSGGLYSTYKNPATGLPYTEKISFFKDIPGINGGDIRFVSMRYFINTTTVRKYIQDHFGCEDLPYGAELENNGGKSNVGSHWKLSRFGEEMMVGYAAPIAPLTGLTLALLYDTGWYEITNQESVEQTIWGKGKGCGFINDYCSYKNWNYTGYWPASALIKSTQGNIYGCSATRVGKGNATWGYMKITLNFEYQHFLNQSIGGASKSHDYCVFNIPSRYCFDNSSTAATVQGEIFGPGSACFIEKNNNGIEYGCRPQRCKGSTLQFQYLDRWYDCKPGTNVSITNITTIKCPDSFDKTCGPDLPVTSSEDSSINSSGESSINSSEESSINSSVILQSFNLLFFMLIGSINLFI